MEEHIRCRDPAEIKSWRSLNQIDQIKDLKPLSALQKGSAHGPTKESVLQSMKYKSNHLNPNNKLDTLDEALTSLDEH